MNATNDLVRSRIVRRRRVALRAGLAVLVLASLTACIFDKSDYQGGGRQGKGATASTASGSSTTSAIPTDTTMPTDTTQPIGLDGGQDAG